jgi:tRNA U34 2-thiouridine synthase MnmA/TrmU
MDDGALVVTFERPVRAASPGQFAVAYVDDEVIAGGIITSVGGGSIALHPGSVSK